MNGLDGSVLTGKLLMPRIAPAALRARIQHQFKSVRNDKILVSRNGKTTKCLGHFPYSQNFFVSPFLHFSFFAVSGHFPYSWVLPFFLLFLDTFHDNRILSFLLFLDTCEPKMSQMWGPEGPKGGSLNTESVQKR